MLSKLKEWFVALFTGKPVDMTPEPTVVEAVEPEVREETDLNSMTKAELIEFAKGRGVKLHKGLVKAEMIKRISKAVS